MASKAEFGRKKKFADHADQIDETIIAWFAGWLCADGSIMVEPNGRPKIRFTICDQDPLARFAKIFQNKVGGPYAPSGLGKKPRFTWQLTGTTAVTVLKRCLPWLSARYLEKAKHALQYRLKPPGRKLTAKKAQTIKRKLRKGGHGINRKLAEQYGVTDGLISAIKKGRIWA